MDLLEKLKEEKKERERKCAQFLNDELVKWCNGIEKAIKAKPDKDLRKELFHMWDIIKPSFKASLLYLYLHYDYLGSSKSDSERMHCFIKFLVKSFADNIDFSTEFSTEPKGCLPSIEKEIKRRIRS